MFFLNFPAPQTAHTLRPEQPEKPLAQAGRSLPIVLRDAKNRRPEGQNNTLVKLCGMHCQGLPEYPSEHRCVALKRSPSTLILLRTCLGLSSRNPTSDSNHIFRPSPSGILHNHSAFDQSRSRVEPPNDYLHIRVAR